LDEHHYRGQKVYDGSYLLQSLTAYLTTSKIRDGSWRGTDNTYLNHWNEQMRKLVEYSPTTPMTDDFKLTLLKNAVQDASHLASVESAYDVTTRLGSGTPGAIDYNGYMEVLLSFADYMIPDSTCQHSLVVSYRIL
jgi:hypothetical protein